MRHSSGEVYVISQERLCFTTVILFLAAVFVQSHSVRPVTLATAAKYTYDPFFTGMVQWKWRSAPRRVGDLLRMDFGLGLRLLF